MPVLVMIGAAGPPLGTPPPVRTAVLLIAQAQPTLF
jgi:hypothetical protein